MGNHGTVWDGQIFAWSCVIALPYCGTAQSFYFATYAQTPDSECYRNILHFIVKKKHYSRNCRAPYRKAAERPRPDLPADANVNRLQKQLGTRHKPDLLDQVKNAAEREGITKQEWVERALLRALDRS